MKKQNQKEEIQSRREFFKKAAQTALPILGVTLLASNPVVAKAAEKIVNNESGCYWGCSYTCTGTCSSCTGTCLGCTGTCTSCTGTCTSCIGTCVGTCVGGCWGLVYY